jgi:SAM-dependent methyltransferase
MSSHHEYFGYLKSRSRIGGLYRKFWLYPRLSMAIFGRALDVGCGIGDFLAFRSNTVGTDVNPFCVEYCHINRREAKVMNADVLPFASGEFDSVLLDNVMEHIAKPGSLLVEIHRVLKSEGTLVVGVPGIKGWSSDSDHKIFYDEALLTSTVERAGFKCVDGFATPLWKSDFLSRTLRQYCIYACFTRCAATQDPADLVT